MRNINNIISVLVLVLISLFATAQEFSEFTTKDYKKDANYGWFNYVQVTGYKGQHMVSGEYADFFTDGFWGTGIRIGTQSTGRKDWQRIHNYPQYGVGVSFFNLGGTDVEELIGKPTALYFFYGAPIKRWAKYRLNGDVELGLSTDFNKYDADNNSEQIFIGATTNLHSNFGLQLYRPVSERMDMGLGLSFFHFSNGKMFSPNKGINLLALNLSASYHYNPVKRFTKSVNRDYLPALRPTFVDKALPEFQPYHEVSFMGSVGTVQPGPGRWRHEDGILDTTTAVGPRYFVNTYSVDYAYCLSHHVKFAGGLDLFYDGSTENNYDDILPQDTKLRHRTFYGVHVGFHYLVERMSFIFNYGRYVYKPFSERGKWYMRVGGRIGVSENVDIQITLKTRDGGVADFIEWGAVYKLKWK
ncbi:acyloxyacyl hydrolase [Prolixibacteraceae bacterium Z1-6]|uniref:Acyloxyacyl hydrolase n=1 Tax=Draconibacterium aestuarii TaxID=2998507 RepID=A0A9X3F9G6_9BACT|nr:acyloxyacyl hydrolase [Prolixibacteraceae bacterium Z1-6]